MYSRALLAFIFDVFKVWKMYLVGRPLSIFDLTRVDISAFSNGTKYYK